MFDQQTLDQLANRIADILECRLSRTSLPKLLDLKQAGVYLSRSPRAVRHLITSGTITHPIVKHIGSRVFLDREELDKWIAIQ